MVQCIGNCWATNVYRHEDCHKNILQIFQEKNAGKKQNVDYILLPDIIKLL